jgi:colanic acid biosynthesis glycosyl transferase WcaI
MKRNITNKLGQGSENKVIIAGYWIDTKKFFRSDSLKARFREMHGYSPDDVVIGYAGNIGKKQYLEKLIEYAADLATIDDRFKIVIAGDGANRANIESAVKENRMENVKMLPLQKGGNYLEFLNGVDISYITQTEDANNMFIPSKLYTTMASGSPVICFAHKDSELAEIMRSSGGAFLYSWVEKDLFLGDMKKLLVDKKIISIKSDAIYKFAKETFTRKAAVLEFLEAVES